MVPWWIKIALKIILSRIPLAYKIWFRLGLFKHGKMIDPNYSIKTFCKHFDPYIELFRKKFNILEIGPGDSIATSLISKKYGSKECYLVDVGNFADKSLYNYENLFKVLYKNKLNTFNYKSFQDILEKNNTKYLIDGLKSLQGIENNKFDFIFSNAALEHVKLKEFILIQKEIFRILKPNGIISHEVDLRDHLGGGLNNLRFSERVWESNLFSNSGFYTNRIRFDEMIKIFKNIGFNVRIKILSRWQSPPLKLRAMSKKFRTMNQKNMDVSVFNVILKK